MLFKYTVNFFGDSVSFNFVADEGTTHFTCSFASIYWKNIRYIIFMIFLQVCEPRAFYSVLNENMKQNYEWKEIEYFINLLFIFLKEKKKKRKLFSPSYSTNWAEAMLKNTLENYYFQYIAEKKLSCGQVDMNVFEISPFSRVWCDVHEFPSSQKFLVNAIEKTDRLLALDEFFLLTGFYEPGSRYAILA